MSTHHETLGIASDATPSQAKAAYHRKLREFPAHTHPAEFKAIRAAYEAVQKGDRPPVDDFFTMRPIQDDIEPETLETIKKKLTAQLAVSLDEMLRETF
jgi:hypothetical protein